MAFFGTRPTISLSYRQDAVTSSFSLDHFIDAVHGGVFKIGEVNGNLGKIAGL